MNQVCILLTIFLICYNNYCVLAGGIGFNTSDIKNGNCVIATPADLVKTEHVHKTGIPFMTRSATVSSLYFVFLYFLFRILINIFFYCLQINTITICSLENNSKSSIIVNVYDMQPDLIKLI